MRCVPDEQPQPSRTASQNNGAANRTPSNLMAPMAAHSNFSGEPVPGGDILFTARLVHLRVRFRVEHVMATIHKEIHLQAAPEIVWGAARDIGALHTRLVPGFVIDTQLDGRARTVTFANGLVVREPIISVDDQRRRLAWTAVGGRTTHYNAVLQILADGSGTRVIWTIDLLPDEMADSVAAMQENALTAMKQTFDRM